MIAALRTTLATALVALACAFATTPAATAGPTAGPTAAECEPLDLDDPAAVQERAAAVTDVFAGKVREVEPRSAAGGGDGKTGKTDTTEQDPQPTDRSGDEQPRPTDPRTTRWQHTVTVVSPFQSAFQPGDRTLIVTQPAGIAGGLGKLEKGATYVFFVNGEQGMDHLLAGTCSGTTKLVGGLTAEMQSRLEETLGEPADEAVPDYSLTAPTDGARSTPALGRLAAPGAAVALLGVLGLLLVARISSRR